MMTLFILKVVFIHIRGSLKYRELRLGYNGKCRNLYPRVILRPESTKDVAIAVRAAKKLRMEVIIYRDQVDQDWLSVNILQSPTPDEYKKWWS